ncbi:MAG: hypothetical protein ABSD92_09855 [Candidatus Bathyarchaeia archaeon]|jgi:hypothetical protein
MEQLEVDNCCESGVKGSCVTCKHSTYCNSQWNHGTGQATNTRHENNQRTEDLINQYIRQRAQILW